MAVRPNENFLISKLDFVANFVRASSLWPMPFATACCGIELMATASSRYDLARFGAEVMRFTPRQCDMMIVAGRVTALTTQGHEPLKAIFEKELPALKDLGVKDISSRRMIGSDHQSFDSAGVPGIMFQQDPAEYRLTHHSQSDTLDKAKEPDLIQGAQVMAIMATHVANLPSLLPREPARQGRGGAGN